MKQSILNKPHFGEIDICKGLAILAVLWNHSFILFPINIHALPWCQHAAAINSTFFLVIFFVVSGFLFSAPPGRDLCKTLKKKVVRLLIPYLTYSFINLLLKIVFPSVVNRSVESISDYVLIFLLYGGELWFVYVLFIILCLWSILLPYLNRCIIVGVVFLLLFIDIWVNPLISNDILLITRVTHYSIFFLIGYLIRQKDSYINYIRSNSSLIFSLLLFFPICCVFVVNVQSFFPPLFRILTKLIGCWFIWSISFRIHSIKFVSETISYIGKNSLGYYWLNGFVLVVVRTLIVSVMNIQSSVIIAIGVFISCVLIETILIVLIKKMPYIGKIIGV